MNAVALLAGRVLRGISLFSGVGALDLGIRVACPAYRTVCYVEREAFAASRLVARMADQALPDAPVWDDASTFDGRPWRGVVDIVLAGFPCQPVSSAGKRRGADDDRWLWPVVERILGDVEPSLVFLENTPGILTRGGTAVLGSLAALGFDAEWLTLSSASVGASHERERFWLLAHARRRRVDAIEPEPIAASSGPTAARGPRADVANPWCGAGVEPPRSDEERRRAADAEQARMVGRGLAHAHEQRREQGERSLPPRTVEPHVEGLGVGLADTDGDGRPFLGSSSLLDRERAPLGDDADRRGREGARGDDSIPRYAPARNDLDAWRRVLAVDPRLEPAVRRDADGLAHRLDRLHAIGNGVDPLAAAVAFRVLWDRLMGGAT